MNFGLSFTQVIALFSILSSSVSFAYSETNEGAPENYTNSLEEAPATPTADTLLMAIFLDDAPRFKELLAQGQDPNATDEWGIQLLNHASALGELEIMQMIIDAGVDVNVKSGSRKSTPAHSAVRFGQLDALKLLVQAEADLTITNAEGQTPGQIAQDYEFDDIVSYLQSIELNTSSAKKTLN